MALSIRGAILSALWRAGLLVSVAGCGDNLHEAHVEITPAGTLFVVAHLDDDMIFMQPELRDTLDAGSMTTVYVSSGDAVHGRFRTAHTFMSARMAYSRVTGSSDVECGYPLVNGYPVHHCRFQSDEISQIGLDVADGGLEGQLKNSPLHLIEGKISELPIVGPHRGSVTRDALIGTLLELITTTHPAQLHTLDLASTHGRDHSGHLLSAAFAFWAAARARYDGPITFHRGYNVREEQPTLARADYTRAKPLLRYFEACYSRCAPCGTPCQVIDESHDAWMQRQYSSRRAPLDARGALVHNGSGACLVVASGNVVTLGDCAAAADVQLDRRGRLLVGSSCVTSSTGNDGDVVLAPCDDTRPEQYWVSDSEGFLWNGQPVDPVPMANMYYDHVRCLDAGATPGAALTAPVCGSRRQPRWHFAAR